MVDEKRKYKNKGSEEDKAEYRSIKDRIDRICKKKENRNGLTPWAN